MTVVISLVTQTASEHAVSKCYAKCYYIPNNPIKILANNSDVRARSVSNAMYEAMLKCQLVTVMSEFMSNTCLKWYL